MQVERQREYETIYILRPNVDDADVEKTVERFNSVLEAGGGHKLRFDEWGSRRLAYEIRDRTMGEYHDRGIFHYCRFLAPPSAIGELERNLRIIEPVLKFMTVKIDDDVVVEERLAATGETPEEPAVEAAPEAAPAKAAPEAEEKPEAPAETAASEAQPAGEEE